MAAKSIGKNLCSIIQLSLILVSNPKSSGISFHKFIEVLICDLSSFPVTSTFFLFTRSFFKVKILSLLLKINFASFLAPLAKKV